MLPRDREPTLYRTCTPSILPADDHELEEGEADIANPTSKSKQVKHRLEQLEQEYNRFAQNNLEIQNILPLESAKRLMRILDVNAHSLKKDDKDELKSPVLALFAGGSKVEHSCHPNCTWIANDGKL